MSLAYIVRCNFNDPSREQAWNDWYSGPKLRQMLQKPFFLTGQRFHRAAGTGRDYVAFWTLASQDAFTTPEYTNDWGFFEWRPYIIDWSRDLFEPETSDFAAPDLRDGQVLRMISFEGLDAEAAATARRRVAETRPRMTWLRSVGLDRHTSILGFGVEDRASAVAALPTELGAVEVVYEPISILARVQSPADAVAR